MNFIVVELYLILAELVAKPAEFAVLLFETVAVPVQSLWVCTCLSYLNSFPMLF